MQTKYLVTNKASLDGLGRPLISSQEVEHELEWLHMATHLYVSVNQLDVNIICEKQDDKVFVTLKTNDLKTNLDNIIQDVLLNMNQKKIWLSLVAKVLDTKHNM